jgi:hypothetical protein
MEQFQGIQSGGFARRSGPFMTNSIDRSNFDSNRVHGRAIRDEIGERLRILLRRPARLSARLLLLVRQLAKADR